MKHMLLPAGLVFGLFALLGCSAEPPAEPTPPNIILLLADDLGYSDLSAYRERLEKGYEPIATGQTPHVDRLAAEGILFTDFYAGAAVCSPSRGALLTGRNSTRLGIYNWIPPNQPMHLRDEEVTLAEMLRPLGYRTGHFGKWHLTAEGMGQPLPRDQGFGYSFFAYNNAQPSHHNPENYFRNGEPVGPLTGYACHLVVDEALAWLDTLSGDRPFYLNIWFNEPHERVAAPDSLARRHPRRPQYYGSIENMDLAVGRVLDFLRERGLERNTLVIFTSDNGSPVPGSNQPLLGKKALNFEGGLRVPMLMRWPERLPAGAVRRTPGSFTDILPTLATLTGAERPAGTTLDGIDLSPLLNENAREVEREDPIFFFRYFHEPVTMLRQGDWCLLGYNELIEKVPDFDQRALAKLQPDPGTPRWSMWGFQPAHMAFLDTLTVRHVELYNLREDIRQEHDLADQYPERARSMRETLLKLKEEMLREGGDWYP